MADNDYPSDFLTGGAVAGATQTDPQTKPTTDPHADPYPRVPDSPAPRATEVSPQEKDDDYLKWAMEMMKRHDEREERMYAQAAPYREALMKEMMQPLPQPPSMTQASPYGPPPDPQANRQGIVSGILYGLLGLGLAKIFAGRNKFAYYGAMAGIGDALQKRNAGNQEAANESFNRWVKLQELWHQQLRERSEDYKLALENRKFTMDQKLEAIKLISNLHGNTQTEAAAGRGDMESVWKLVDHFDKLRIAQQQHAEKMQESWAKGLGTTQEDREYRDFLMGHNVNPYDPVAYARAQQAPASGREEDDLRRITWMQKHPKEKPETHAEAEEEQKKTEEEEVKRQMDQINFGPSGQRATPTPTPSLPAGAPAFMSGGGSIGMLPAPPSPGGFYRQPGASTD